MLPKTPQKPPLGDAIGFFLRGNWRSSMGGFLLGTVAGLISPTISHEAVKISRRLFELINQYSRGVTTWPKRGAETLLAIVLVAALFYTIRLAIFLKRFWLSFQAGLLSGIGFVWFVTSAVTFSALNLNGSHLSLLFLGVGIIVTFMLVQRDLKIAERDMPSETDLDGPISKSEEDILGRGAVVTSIVRAVFNDHAPVVALTGPYGDGKTSVLNLLSKELEKLKKDAVFVRFSPWLPMDEKALVSALLTAVLAKLETRLFIPKLKRGLAAVTRLLFSVLPRVPAPFADLVEKPSQDQQLSELRRILARLPIRVVVLLDDLDRMHKKELDVLFKLLRGVPEFPQFTYVCAFHRESLAQTLASDGSTMSVGQALVFLEKFFFDEIPLPQIEPACLAVEFEKRFYAICDRNSLITETTERQKLKDELRTIWQKHLKGYFSNLRRLKIFTNRLSRSLSVVGQEVNLLDFALLETVRMINPVLYEEIFRNATYFMYARWRFTTWPEIIHADEEEEQKIRSSYFDILFKDLPRPPQGLVLALLSEIFPTVNSYLTGGRSSGRASQNPDEAQQQRRVYHPDFFPRYFMLNVPADLFGEKEISSFAAAMNQKGDAAKCIETFKEKYAGLQELPMKRWDFLRRVSLSIEKFNSIALQGLITAISELSDKMENEEAAFDEIRGRKIVFEVANRLQASIGAQTLLEGVIRNATSDMFATEVLNECVHNRNRLLADGGAIYKDQLELAFRERMAIKYALGSQSSFFPKDERPNIVPLGRWALCGPEGREQVHAYLRREFLSAHRNIGRLLTYFFPLRDAHPGADSLTALMTYFPPDELHRLLEEYGSSSFSSPEESQAIEEFKSRFNERQLST